MDIRRRQTLAALAACYGHHVLTGPVAFAGGSDEFETLLSTIRHSPDIVDSMRAFREFPELVMLDLERPPSRQPPSDLKISDRSKDVIIYCEISSEQAYEARYQRPTWPKGMSGVTIGIGYDLGYTTTAIFKSDWRARLSSTAIDYLSAACEITGPKAEGLAQTMSANPDTAIPWTVAKLQFLESELPRYAGLTQRSLPNLTDLGEDARGALVSLVYNRGASFTVPLSKDPEGRYTEMRNIHGHMQNRDFAAIPAEIRNMKRLWAGKADLAGLVIRRELEATLLEKALK